MLHRYANLHASLKTSFDSIAAITMGIFSAMHVKMRTSGPQALASVIACILPFRPLYWQCILHILFAEKPAIWPDVQFSCSPVCK